MTVAVVSGPAAGRRAHGPLQHRWAAEHHSGPGKTNQELWPHQNGPILQSPTGPLGV